MKRECPTSYAKQEGALDGGYTGVCGKFADEEWHRVLCAYEDANLYQTRSYETAGARFKDVLNLTLKREEKVVAAAQARIVRLPFLRVGIAYVLWGPMWRLKGAPENIHVFRQAIRFLRNELSLRRGLVLRIYPLAFRGENEALRSILEEEGYQPYDEGKTKRTLIIDLEPSLKEIRADLEQKWRNCLNRAEKNCLELVSGEDEALFEEVGRIHREMIDRKGLGKLSDLDHLLKTQRSLPPEFRMKVILCRLNGETCAGAIFSAMGSWGIYLVGATSKAGMKTNGSYLVQWAFLKWLKENRFSHYDLNGINPETNPGTYRFKRGLAGKRGRDVEFLGKFQVADNRASSFVVKNGELLLTAYRKLQDRKISLRAASGNQAPEK